MFWSTNLFSQGYSLGQLLLTILRLLVECLALKDFIDSSRDYGDNVSSLVCYAAEQCDQIIFREKSTAPKTKAWFLSQLQPAWLKYRLVEFLFHRFNDKFVSEEYRNLSTRNLSMEKIVRISLNFGYVIITWLFLFCCSSVKEINIRSFFYVKEEFDFSYVDASNFQVVFENADSKQWFLSEVANFQLNNIRTSNDSQKRFYQIFFGFFF